MALVQYPHFRLGSKKFRIFQADPVEIYWPVGQYGFARMYKQYGNYPLDKPMPALMPHGILFDERLFPEEVRTPYGAILSFPAFYDQVWEGAKVAVPACHPFLYHLAMNPPKPMTRKGTVAFPTHSTMGATANFGGPVEGRTNEEGWWDFYEKLKALPKEFHPITVSLHEYDVQQGREKYFPGMRVVTAGNARDPEMIPRQVELLNAAEYACSNDAGSCLFFAIECGARFFMLGDPPYYHASKQLFTERKEEIEFWAGFVQQPPMAVARMMKVREAFAEIGSPVTQDQQDIVDYYMRREAFKTRKQFHEDLLYCESLLPSVDKSRRLNVPVRI